MDNIDEVISDLLNNDPGLANNPAELTDRVNDMTTGLYDEEDVEDVLRYGTYLEENRYNRGDFLNDDDPNYTP